MNMFLLFMKMARARDELRTYVDMQHKELKSTKKNVSFFSFFFLTPIILDE